MSAQFVVAEGHGPNATQRQQALDRGAKVKGAAIPPTAVLTRSPLVRGSVTLFNLQRVQELRPLLHGEHPVILRDRTTLKLSRGYRERLDTLLAQG
ncbi:hypothetical protein JYK02_18205 [Corallococcus macrosporus]|uniref:Uncharacterized protein n=1 Tax=Corallococcus macrosporus TaxID=35 RepID=A0ABS3DCS8_9BACT|nr:hypothetical protein [Corallococcus macrosporus]MBN8229447.1 hypothetical protein [Corallococcus macrosporus]